MGIGFRHSILILLVLSSIAIYLPYARGGCGRGPCSLGGGSSYDFLGDPAVDIDMSSFDEFARDNLGNHQTILPAKSLSQETLSNTTSINQTNKGNVSQNSSAVSNVIDSQVNTTTDNTPVKLGASGMQDKRLSTLAFTAFDNNIF